MKRFKYLAPLAVLFLGFTIKQPALTQQQDDDFCNITNTTTQTGERLTFHVFYSVVGIYVNAGTATFTNTLEKLNGRPVYHIVGDGQTNSSYEWAYKVRDKYESYIDTATMRPLKFVRNISEGGYKKYQTVSFNRTANTAISNDGVYKVPTCVQDVLSAIFYARNINFEKLKVNDKINFSMFLDNEVNQMYIRYLGKEDVKTKYGKFKAIKFKPLLIKGTMFEGGEKMTVWVSDDANHIPLRIESPISVGSVKVDLMSYSNLRNPFTSKKKVNGI